jgi:hypothetical protein
VRESESCSHVQYAIPSLQLTLTAFTSSRTIERTEDRKPRAFVNTKKRTLTWLLRVMPSLSSSSLFPSTKGRVGLEIAPQPLNLLVNLVCNLCGHTASTCMHKHTERAREREIAQAHAHDCVCKVPCSSAREPRETSLTIERADMCGQKREQE